jgi:MerR family transcriptional regulator, light-induced transcriptional regulator
MTDGNLYPIGVVERDTGIGRDTLRVWERRYGFPSPVRNEKGERAYPESQLRRLQRVRRLLDQGMRPGKLLPLNDQELDAVEGKLVQVEAVDQDENVSAVLQALSSADSERIEFLLRAAQESLGMEDFIRKLVTPLLRVVGDRWASGDLQIYEEHFISQMVSGYLNSAITDMHKTCKKPVVLLATLPGEQHTLGLLMVSALLSSHGIRTYNLGGEVPMDQISHAVRHFCADALGVSFSSSYQYKNIRPHLVELRELINDEIEIWTGGEGVRRVRKLPAGVSKFTTLDHLPFCAYK